MNEMNSASPGQSSLPASRHHDQQALTLYDPNINNRFDEDEIDLLALWRVVVRYRKLIALILVLITVGAAVSSMLKRPVYSATALLEINSAGRNLVKFQNVESDEIALREHLSTQSRILSSKAVAIEVIKRLDLGSAPELNGQLRQRDMRNGVKALLRLIKPSPSNSEISVLANPRDLNSPAMRSVVKRYLSRLSIDPVRKSSLINVRFRSFDPELSAQIVNEHLKAYIWLSAQRRYDSTSGAKAFLEKEISNIQGKLASSQKQLTEFARTHGVIDTEERNNIMIERLAILNQDLSNVQSKRIDAETLFIQSQSSGSDELAVVINDGLIKDLRQEHAALSSEYYQQLKVYKADYPAMLQMRAQLAELESNIKSQADKRLAVLRTDFEQLSLREAHLKAELETFKAQMLDLQDKSVQYNILKRELEANKRLYAGLLERTKEVGVAAGVELNVASIVDRAVAPGSAASAGLTENLMKASIIGLLAGLAAAFVLAMLDNRVNDAQQLRKVTHVNHLGVAPAIESSGIRAADEDARIYMFNTITHQQPASVFSEAMHSVRTSLAYMRNDGLPKSIMVTSAVAGEGKSTIAMNLAVSCAKSGMRVMLVDADLRRSRHHHVFNVPSSPGLSEYLADQAPETFYGFKEIDGLSMMVSGERTPSPMDLLRSSRMRELIQRYEQEHELVVIDCPPVHGIADSVLISTLVEAVLMVVGADQAPQDAIKSALQRLRMVNAPIVGTVLNNAVATGNVYGAYPYESEFRRAG